jgi:hypothetical protein
MKLSKRGDMKIYLIVVMILWSDIQNFASSRLAKQANNIQSAKQTQQTTMNAQEQRDFVQLSDLAAVASAIDQSQARELRRLVRRHPEMLNMLPMTARLPAQVRLGCNLNTEYPLADFENLVVLSFNDPSDRWNLFQLIARGYDLLQRDERTGLDGLDILLRHYQIRVLLDTIVANPNLSLGFQELASELVSRLDVDNLNVLIQVLSSYERYAPFLAILQQERDLRYPQPKTTAKQTTAQQNIAKQTPKRN